MLNANHIFKFLKPREGLTLALFNLDANLTYACQKTNAGLRYAFLKLLLKLN